MNDYERSLDAAIKELSAIPDVEPLEVVGVDEAISELQAEVAMGPMTFEEYVADKNMLDARPTGEKVLAFGESALTGAKALFVEGAKAVGDVFSGDVGLEELEGVYDVGVADLKRFGKTIAGSARDMVSGTDEENLQNEYKRYRENFDYYNKVRPKMVEASTTDAPDFVSFGANFVDPTMLIPLAGPAAKLGAITLKSARLGKLAKAIDKVGEAASLPAKGAAVAARKALKTGAKVAAPVAKAVGRVGEKAETIAGRLATAGGVAGGVITDSVTGGITSAILAGNAGKVAKVTGQGMERVMTALGSEAGQKRFLQRLAIQAESPSVRQAALIAHRLGGTKLGDAMFNSVVNGASVGALNSALAFASGGGVEEAGQAFGQGAATGGFAVFDQPGMKAGKSIEARGESSIRFMQSKMVDNQIKAFRKLSPEARLVFANLEEAGVPSPSLVFLSRQNYLDYIRSKNPDAKSVPNAEYDPADRTIYVNQDGDMARGSREALQIVTEELGHHFITEAIKDDPLFAHRILEEYRDTTGKGKEFVFTRDPFGKPIDSIRINKDGQRLAEAYDSLFGDDAPSMGIGDDANRLAQEIGANHFSLMLSENPKALDVHPIIMEHMTRAGEKVLSLYGGANPYTGNVFDKGMAPLVRKSKPIQTLYKNYLLALEKKQVARDDSVKAKPRLLPKGTTADKDFKERYGQDGITLTEASTFFTKDGKAKDALKQELSRAEQGISEDIDPDLQLEARKADNLFKQSRKDRNKAKKESESDPTDPAKKQAFEEAEQAFKQAESVADSARSKAKRSGEGMIFQRGMLVGKKVPSRILSLFTDGGRKDPKGRIKSEVEKIENAIANKRQMVIVYRSAKPSAFGDREADERFFTPVQFKVSKIKSGNPQLQIDVIDERYLRMNLEAMVRDGLVDDPDALLTKARRVAREAIDDPEDRINPLGKFENEDVTALFGLSSKADAIRDPKLKAFLKKAKRPEAFRTFDLSRAAGLKETGVDGISFDWENVKSNYMPFHGE